MADGGNCVWAAWQNGAMERFSFNGKLLARKVSLFAVPLSTLFNCLPGFKAPSRNFTALFPGSHQFATGHIHLRNENSSSCPAFKKRRLSSEDEMGCWLYACCSSMLISISNATMHLPGSRGLWHCSAIHRPFPSCSHSRRESLRPTLIGLAGSGWWPVSPGSGGASPLGGPA